MTESRATDNTNSTGSTATRAQQKKMMEVVAPANLEAGYQFDATYDGDKTVQVTVPEGGVTEGQKFTVALPEDSVDKTTKVADAETGQWRDGIFDCFKQGLCHPMLCTACWCTPIALAQVMTRMKLTWLAMPGSKKQVNNTVMSVAILTCAFLLLMITFGAIPKMAWLVTVGWILFLAYFLFVGIKTRGDMRQHYNISGSGCSDCCCLFFCSCCTVSQMGRHTHDYDSYRGVCCSRTGLPEDTPSIV